MTIPLTIANPTYTLSQGTTVSASDGSALFELALIIADQVVSVAMTLNNYGSLV